MMDLSPLYETRKHVVVNSHSVTGCRVHKVGSYIHGGRVRNHYDISEQKVTEVDKVLHEQIMRPHNQLKAKRTVKNKSLRYGILTHMFTEHVRCHFGRFVKVNPTFSTDISVDASVTWSMVLLITIRHDIFRRCSSRF